MSTPTPTDPARPELPSEERLAELLEFIAYPSRVPSILAVVDAVAGCRRAHEMERELDDKRWAGAAVEIYLRDAVLMDDGKPAGDEFTGEEVVRMAASELVEQREAFAAAEKRARGLVAELLFRCNHLGPEDELRLRALEFAPEED